MRRQLPIIISAALTIATCLISCTTNISISEPKTNMATPTSEILEITKEQWNNETFTLGGTADLLDGTYLQTELYKNDQPTAWWPVTQYIQVQDEKWQIIVNIPLNEAPTGEDVASGIYYFKIWQKDNPEVMAKIPFIWSVHPPIPTS